MSGFKLDDYVDVAERIRVFSERFPEGSLQSSLHYKENPPGWFAKAQAFRTPDDPTPGIGHAFEPVPGKTPYTKDSECMNAETAAWGRAIVALGFPTKKIASAQEVQARRDEPASQPAGTDGKEAGATPSPVAPASSLITEPQRKRLFAIAKQCGVDDVTLKRLTFEVAGVESSASIPKSRYEDLIAAVKASDPESGTDQGYTPVDDDIPF